jgi:hypothetical protein
MGIGGNKIGKDVLHNIVNNISNDIFLDLLSYLKWD